MASQISICNMAVVALGNDSDIIMNLEENTKTARVLRVAWDISVKDVLRDHNWGFAKKRAQLAQLADVPLFGFAYAYKLPSDFVRLAQFGETPEDHNELDFVLEGQNLLTDEEECKIVYVSHVTDTGLFDAKFVSALSLKLAADVADALTGTTSGKREAMLKLYDRVLTDAETIDSQESSPQQYVPNRWTDARR